MKILRLFLVLFGAVFVLISLYNILVPQDLFELGPIVIDFESRDRSQLWAMFGIGILGIIGGLLIQNRR